MIDQSSQNIQLNKTKVISSKRKTDVINLLHEFLIKTKFIKTVQKLKQQALIADKQNIQEYIDTIQNSNNLQKDEKHHKIKIQLEKRYLKEIANNNLQQALHLLNNKMINYFKEQDIDNFAQNLISPQNQLNVKKNQCILNNMFEQYFIHENQNNPKLPNIRQKIYKTKAQIWFVKFSGQYLITIDQQKNGKIFTNKFQILFQKQNLHQNMISNVQWRNKQQFATCSQLGQIKIWNFRFQQLYQFHYHKKLINSLIFYQNISLKKEILISAGHDNYIVFNQNFSNKQNNNQKETKIKIKQVLVRDIKCYKKRNQLIFLNEKKNQKSIIKFFNLNTMKWITQIKSHQFFLGLEIYQSPNKGISNKNDDILYAMTQNGQIYNYSLKTHQKIHVFIGISAGHFVIRMEIGGYMNKYLATGSQNGEILIFNQKRIQPIKKLKTIQKTVVNTVTWINQSTIVCGCDNGYLQLWKYQNY